MGAQDMETKEPDYEGDWQMTDIRKVATLVTVRLPPGDDPVRRHIENVAYDDGTRHALHQQLTTLIEQADRQARRSFRTTQGPLSGDHEHDLWESDDALRRALKAAIERAKP